MFKQFTADFVSYILAVIKQGVNMGAFSDLDKHLDKGKEKIQEGKEKFEEWREENR